MKSLQQRLLYAMLAGTLLFAVVGSTIAYQLSYERAIVNGKSTLEGLLAAIEKTAAVGAYTNDPVLLQEIVDGVSQNPLAQNVQVLNSLGKSIASSNAASQAAASETPSLSVKRMLHSPFDKSEILGSLSVAVNTKQLQATARTEAVTLTLFIAAQTLMVALLLYLLAARLVSAPIVTLADKLRHLKPGTSDRVSHPRLHRHDEIGTLISSTNDMLTTTEIAMQRERKLRGEISKMEARYRRIFDSSSAGIFVIGDDGRLVNCNPTTIKILGLSDAQAEQLSNVNLVNRVFANPEQVHQMITQAIESDDSAEADLRLQTVDQNERWVHCVLSAHKSADEFGVTAWESSFKPIMIEGVIYDITERKLAESAIRHRAEHDSLTGLANREAANAVLTRYLHDAQQENSTFAVMYIDLDGFKRVNDLIGHKAGDQVLVQCAGRMRSAVRRSTDLIARIGGDEFLVAMYGTDCADTLLMQVAGALVAHLCEPVILDDGQVAQIGASVGVACYPRHGTNIKTLLQSADNAMYEVKRTHKNAYALAWLAAADTAAP